MTPRWSGIPSTPEGEQDAAPACFVRVTPGTAARESRMNNSPRHSGGEPLILTGHPSIWIMVPTMQAQHCEG